MLSSGSSTCKPIIRQGWWAESRESWGKKGSKTWALLIMFKLKCYIWINYVTLKSRTKGDSLDEEASVVVGESDSEWTKMRCFLLCPQAWMKHVYPVRACEHAELLLLLVKERVFAQILDVMYCIRALFILFTLQKWTTFPHIASSLLWQISSWGDCCRR